MVSLLVVYYWGKPKQAPHKYKVCTACLSVCLSVCLYVHDTKIYKSSTKFIANE